MAATDKGGGPPIMTNSDGILTWFDRRIDNGQRARRLGRDRRVENTRSLIQIGAQ